MHKYYSLIQSVIENEEKDWNFEIIRNSSPIEMMTLAKRQIGDYDVSNFDKESFVIRTESFIKSVEEAEIEEYYAAQLERNNNMFTFINQSMYIRMDLNFEANNGDLYGLDDSLGGNSFSTNMRISGTPPPALKETPIKRRKMDLMTVMNDCGQHAFKMKYDENDETLKLFKSWHAMEVLVLKELIVDHIVFKEGHVLCTMFGPLIYNRLNRDVSKTWYD